MAGPILQSETKVAWASRTNSPPFTRVERINSISSADSPGPRSPRTILPLAEQRFADSSPSPYTTSSPALGRNPYSQSLFPVTERASPLSSGAHEGPVDVDGMYIPGVGNDGDGQTPNQGTVSAPAELHQSHRKITLGTPETKFSADVVSGRHESRNRQLSKLRTHSTPIQKVQQAMVEKRQQESYEFHLDRTAPVRALRHPPASASSGAGGQSGSSLMRTIEEQRGQSGTPETPLDAAKKGESPEVDGEDEPERVPSPGQAEGAIDKRAEEPPTWGEPFRLEWIKAERLPFYRTRHLRNPWNHDREIKVSRDGTELEPSVGQALLEEWDRVIETPSAEKAPQQPGGTGGGGRQQGRGKGGVTGGGVQKGKR